MLLLSVDSFIGSNLIDLSSNHGTWTTLAILFDSHAMAQEDFIDLQQHKLINDNKSMMANLKEVHDVANQFAWFTNPWR